MNDEFYAAARETLAGILASHIIAVAAHDVKLIGALTGSEVDPNSTEMQIIAQECGRRIVDLAIKPPTDARL